MGLKEGKTEETVGQTVEVSGISVPAGQQLLTCHGMLIEIIPAVLQEPT